MTSKQAWGLLLMLVIGFGLASLFSFYFDLPEIGVLVFIATLLLFCYWPLGRKEE